jgi:hypothetical protein
MINEKPVFGVRGFFLYSPISQKYFFRVYYLDGKFIDYDIRCEEIEIELIGEWNSLYHNTETDEHYIDWSSKALKK